MQDWTSRVEAELQKARHEDQKDEYERGYAGGLEMGNESIKVNNSYETAKSAVESQYDLFDNGVQSEPDEFSRGMRDGLKRVLELAK